MPVDPSAYVAPTARVAGDAAIGPGCHIGEYCVIEGGVILGQECVLDPHVYIKRWTTIGDRNQLSAGVVLGSYPLDKAFHGQRSYLIIGNDNRIREHFTISRGTKPESTTRVGNSNFIMTSGHIAHDCVIGDNVVIASCTLVAGYAVVESEAFLSGGVVVHQHTRIGRLAMVGGNTRVNTDLPPFFLYSEFHAAAHGLNLVGLRRAGFSREQISELKRAYRILYRSGLELRAAVAEMEQTLHGAETKELLAFIAQSRRGICREEPRPRKTTPSQPVPSLHD